MKSFRGRDGAFCEAALLTDVSAIILHLFATSELLSDHQPAADLAQPAPSCSSAQFRKGTQALTSAPMLLESPLLPAAHTVETELVEERRTR
jgi:hypothetical protein